MWTLVGMADFEHLSVLGCPTKRCRYYCIRLRCMIMPTRFDFLVRVESTGGANAPRQHVPQEFREAPREAAGPEYLHWLYDEAEKVRSSGSKPCIWGDLRHSIPRSFAWRLDFGR